MKIARVITICVVLISMFLDAEAVRSKRRSQPKDHLPQSKYQNGTNTNEVTFTTSGPEAPRPETTHNQQTLHTNIPLGAKKKTLTVRTDRSKPSRSRGVNRYKANRRRRQLQHSGGKSGVHTGRSYDLKENYIENQQIETVQGPAEAFNEGAVRIEPVYRVTKNRNILDSIVDIVKKIVDPPKSLGPLVGPFNFPGIGDKVYIRLLEPLNSNHLMIRLITHLPVTEIESTFDKNILPPTEIIEHPEVSIISHESLPLSKEGFIGSYEHHSDVHSISSDSLLSSSDNVVQVSKPSNAHVQNIGRTNGYTTGNRNFRTYKLNFKQGNVHGVQKLGHHKRHPSLVSPSRNNRVNSVSPFKLPDQANKTQGSQRATGFQGSVDHVYPFHPSLNESNNEHSKLLTIDFQQLQTPINVSVSEYATYSNPTTSYDRFPNVETFTSPRIPTSINQERQSKNNSKGSTEDGPKYSIEFASKNMRYLNLDGSVEPAIKNSNDEGFKPMEQSSVHSKIPRSVDPHWKDRKGIDVRPSEAIESSTSKANRGELQKRSVGNGDAFLETIRNLNDDRMNYLRYTAMAKTAKRSTKPRCCSQE
ncbi:uncharacterized protein [Bombus fervidus]|uniref:uncharacterized protein n=1 Tax=Bombus fervidus TaxID=203811 RepID=UPI003AB550F4